MIHSAFQFYGSDFLEVRRSAIATIYTAFRSMIQRNAGKPSTKRISTGVLDSLMNIGQELEDAYGDDDDNHDGGTQTVEMIVNNRSLMTIVDQLVEQFSKETDETTKILIHSVVDMIVK